MKTPGWVGGLGGAVFSCAVAVATALAGVAAPTGFEGLVVAYEGSASRAWPRLAAADVVREEVPASALAKDNAGAAAEATATPEGASGAHRLVQVDTGTSDVPAAVEPGPGAAGKAQGTIEVPGQATGGSGAEVPGSPLPAFDEPVVDTGAGPEGSGEAFATDESVLLNFERGDIREVIHSLATALGLSYMIDPRVEGQVTIRTIGRISKDHLLPVFNQILRNNGIAAIKVGEVYHIVPVGEAKTRAILPPSAATRAQLEAADSFIIEIIPLSHVAAEDMAGVLEPFVTPGGDVFSYPRGNLVIVTDLLSNVERLRELAATLDTDAFRGMRTRVYKIENGDLEIISEELASLLASYGHSVDGSTGVSLIPMPRLESLTCISYDPTVFEQIGRWLEVLDIKPEESAARKIHVYHVENTKAADLASVLNELFGEGGGGGPSRSAGGGAFGQTRSSFGRTGLSGRRGGLTGATAEPLMRPRQGGIAAAQQTSGDLRTMTAEQRSLGQTTTSGQLGRAGQQLGRGGQLGRAGQLGGAAGLAAGRAAGGAQAVGGSVGVVLPGGRAAGGSAYGGIPGPPPIFKEEVRIVADEVTNSLVFLAMKQDFEKILEILKVIDVVPRQVVIEVTIAEVTLNKDLEFGVDHAVRFAKVLGEDNLKDSVSSVRPSGGGKVGEDSTMKDAILALATPGAGGMAALITDKDNFAILIRALASRSLVKILSAPHIIAADNREAHIQVGESIPILTSTSQSTLTTAQIVNQVQYRDTGTILTILPQVNSAGLVNMQVSQEVSAVSERKIEGIDSPAFLQRAAETTIVVQDGDSVLIGGIMDEIRTTQRSGVPFIMDIPVLGRLFRFEKAAVKKTELLILITPYVIRSREEALSVTDEFKRVIHGLDQMLEHRKKRPGIDGEGKELRTEGQKPL